MTKIFNSFNDFYSREDKTVNGVSKEFAAAYPYWEAKNESNESCWNCSGCSYCSYCSYCSDCSGCRDCSYCSDCSGCRDCSGCSDCSDCRDCSGCSGCSYCSYCSYCSGCRDCSWEDSLKGENKNELTFSVPVIPNIHAEVLKACSPPYALKMDKWHTCDTTHSRAGWVVVLAGEEGKRLESQTSTLFAAMQIYKKSSPEIRVWPPRFFESDKVAMKDIEKCAELEKSTNNTGTTE